LTPNLPLSVNGYKAALLAVVDLFYQLTFAAQIWQVRLKRIFFYLKLLINATLSLPNPASQAPFLSRIMLRLICL